LLLSQEQYIKLIHSALKEKVTFSLTATKEKNHAHSSEYRSEDRNTTHFAQKKIAFHLCFCQLLQSRHNQILWI